MRDGAALAEEQGTVGIQVEAPPFQIFRNHLNMFGGIKVVHPAQFVAIGAQHDLAVIPPGGTWNVGVGHVVDKLIHQLEHLDSQFATVREKPHGRIISVLGLGYEIDGDGHGISGGIGNDGGLGGTGENIDAATPGTREVSLCLGDIGVSGTNQDVRGTTGEEAQRHRSYGLNPTEFQDHIRTCVIHGEGDCGVNGITTRRR